ncbi:extracellular solute-binding protein [Pelagicoccus sp. SDUM812003]|uniref:ABC transporter substrate-binding protein n=1 Tax=Pelagicoccus sp. SDUM812003 TaxID=3041267 RepID=UPI00280DDF93|nr:extracellular solute-binding protein [Pelagicoccus sp. SDUM812003]MDQ8201413.1 extracellular solute-binding protein [Pelagicoccus sp. SDUM812003]
MSNDKIVLKGITWNHSRGFTPMVATAQRFSELNPQVRIDWEKRSLQEFADKPIADLAEAYDLLVIDHPWSGFAAASGVLEPLNSWLSEAFLADQRVNSVGKSYESYEYDGKQWALAIDAATPVSAFRRDLLEKAGLEVPRTWDELIAVGRKGLLVCSAIPLDVYGNFLNLCITDGAELFPNDEEIVDGEAGLLALERLREMMSYVPERYYGMNPIAALEEMSSTDEAGYDPYLYGYSNYSRAGYAKRHVDFCGVVATREGVQPRTMLGGTGLAISGRSQHKEAAAKYAEFVASPEVQRTLFFYSGGQPGHRSAWLSEECNAFTEGYFKSTLPTLDAAFVRPRYAGYLEFQDNAGFPIHDFLREGGEAKSVLEAVNHLYRESRLAIR